MPMAAAPDTAGRATSAPTCSAASSASSASS
eukprot:CAMPEP_0185172640 /NCGR_PEP_ID=MMETSP1139-20130426/21884_1 /TAXON_ID=298111 /ORGANISM="Pavlova sp., Strain CCMP459" /LENGTH=30 /DNA_ID= /DNA_START= /DNA_END= /DNA_ORIENTATION=